MRNAPLYVALVMLLLACNTADAGPAQMALGQPAEATASPAERGRALFRNKGCVTCHANERIEGATGTFGMGPNLTNYSNDPEFLRRWLARPSAVRPDTEMPNLELSAEEIEALIAFLNEKR